MMITALTRLCDIRVSTGAMDITWYSFWHLTEGCIAVTMVSSTAFRTFLVGHRSHAQRNPDRVPFSKRRKPWKREVLGVEREGDRAKDMGALAEAPRATLVGMRTFMRSHSPESTASVFRSEALVEEKDPWPLPGSAAAESFGAHDHVSLETEMVRFQTLLGLDRLTIVELTDCYEQAPSYAQGSRGRYM